MEFSLTCLYVEWMPVWPRFPSYIQAQVTSALLSGKLEDPSNLLPRDYHPSFRTIP